MDDLGIHFVQLERGGFGLIPVRALDGAPAITAKKDLMDEVRKLKKGVNYVFFERLRNEITRETAEGGEDDEWSSHTARSIHFD